MRITCLIHSLDGGGAERLMAGLASRLAASNQVTLITLEQVVLDRYPVDPVVERIGLDRMRHSKHWWQAIGNNVRTVRAIKKAVVASRPDVVLSFCDKTNVVALVAMRGTRIPVVISEHTDPRYHKIGPVWQRLRQLVYPSAAAAIVLSETIAPTVARWTKRSPVVIPPAIDGERFATVQRSSRSFPEGSIDKPALRVVTLGRLAAEKGTDRAIAAFARVAHAFPDWTLVIGGDGPQRDDLEQQIAQLKSVADAGGMPGLEQRVLFAGWVNDPVQFLAEAEIFVLPSHYEGFPVALLEAMAAGCACIAFDCPSGPRQIIDDSCCGRLVPNDDVVGLGEAMAELMADSEKRLALAACGRRRAARYDWPTFVSAHQQVLEGVV